VSWAKVDDGFWRHPKVAALLSLPRGGEAGFLFILAISWSCDTLTDGEVTERQLARLWGDGVEPLIEVLVEARLLERGDRRFLIHDFLVYNPSREQVLAARAQREEAAHLGGQARLAQVNLPGGRGPDGRVRPAAQPAGEPADPPADSPAAAPAGEPAPSPGPVLRSPNPRTPAPAPEPAGARVVAVLEKHGLHVRQNGHADMLAAAVERAGEDAVLTILETMPTIGSVRAAALAVTDALDRADLPSLNGRSQNGPEPGVPTVPDPQRLTRKTVLSEGPCRVCGAAMTDKEPCQVGPGFIEHSEHPAAWAAS